ncbi:hypothetical protein M0811_03507 [Anaeramoeba ignava]|uniref:Uncharacterized protein n=1 Tax=Anaeramoeba ignava TaxID=1746090 RepID=A0A9Q0R415_ANAIG|nr:hypothetical protein M0811_03507 [Anaeramoeba ignava]
MENFNNFKINLLEARDCGVGHVFLEEHNAKKNDVEKQINDFLQRHNLKPLTDWIHINETKGKEMLLGFLEKDLAYHSRLMSFEQAQGFTNQFFEFFDLNSLQVFTNAEIDGTSVSWSGVTQATFDQIIVCIDNRYIGFVCFEDED